MSDRYRCEKCGSGRIIIGYPDIHCCACGFTAPLIDYPISHNWHRHYSREYRGYDPGSCYPEESRSSTSVVVETEEKPPAKNVQLRLFQLEQDNKQLHLMLNHLYKQITSRDQAAQRVRNFRQRRPNKGIEL